MRGLTLLVKQAPGQQTRFAVCVGKRLGRAVVRNRLRRVTKEALEPFVGSVAPGSEVALLPNPQFESLSAPERVRLTGQLLSKAGLLGSKS